MVRHGGSSAGSYLAGPTSPIPSHCASIVATSTLRVNTFRIFTSNLVKHLPAALIAFICSSVSASWNNATELSWPRIPTAEPNSASCRPVTSGRFPVVDREVKDVEVFGKAFFKNPIPGREKRLFCSLLDGGGARAWTGCNVCVCRTPGHPIFNSSNACKER